MARPIRIVSVMEAATVTGPAKNIIRFAGQARQAADGLPAVDLSFLTFCRTRTSLQSNQFIEAVRQSGLEVDIVRERFAFDHRILGDIAGILKQRNPDIIQTHAIKGHFLLRISSRLRHGRPWIAFHHGYTTENAKMRLYNELNRISLPAADKVITVCNAFARTLQKQGVRPGLIQVLPNSIDPAAAVSSQEVQDLRMRLGIVAGERVLVSVGRFSTEKGHADLIPAMVHLRTLLPHMAIRHILVGDGLERQTIENAARSAGVGPCFLFVGHQRDVRAYYALADVFVLPSHSEGSPNVLLEAMAAGVPSVSTSVGGVPDTITHEHSGLIVNPREPRDLAKATARLLADPDLARSFARAATAEIEIRFTPQAYCRSLVSVYEQLYKHSAAPVFAS